AGESLLGGRGDEELVRHVADRLHLTAEHRRLQVEPGREVPVQRADPDTRPAGDVVERRIRAVLRERRGGRRQQLRAAPPRVSPHPGFFIRPDGGLVARVNAGSFSSAHKFVSIFACSSRRYSLAKRRVPPYSNRSGPPNLSSWYLDSRRPAQGCP